MWVDSPESTFWRHYICFVMRNDLLSQRPHLHAGVLLHWQYSTEMDKPDAVVLFLMGLLDHFVDGANNQVRILEMDVVSRAASEHEFSPSGKSSGNGTANLFVRLTIKEVSPS